MNNYNQHYKHIKMFNILLKDIVKFKINIYKIRYNKIMKK